jgi:signal transduction histidine kinase
VWNTEGASLAFTIAPAWNQTWWFFGLAALTMVATPAVLAVAWQRRRARLAAERTRVRFEAILAERTRLARELHDTVLGGMAGVVLQMDAGARRLAKDDNSAAGISELLSSLGSQTRLVMAEARQSVVAMRASPGARLLHEQLAAVAQRTFGETEVVVNLETAGSSRPYPPGVEAEILSVAGEAMTNARRHSDCRTVWVTCGYGRTELRVGVRDDGRGFDASQGSPMGHLGILGMRERAASIGATLTVTSAPSSGTEVVLVLPVRSGWSAPWIRLFRSP